MTDSRLPMRPVAWHIPVSLGLALLGVIASPARAQVEQLDVGVRSTIMDKPDKVFGTRSLEGVVHGKVYAILSVQPIKSDDHLVKRVDANVLADQVRHELDTHGFRPIAKGGKPDILITVQYGRAWLYNPYFGVEQTTTQGQVLGTPSPDGGTNRIQTITTGTELMKLQGIGMEEKAKRAEYEKLCIKITAWEFPAAAKAKPKQLWHTIMNVDDPDHRDLNAISAELLAAGAPYFDKEIKEDEVEVFRPLPEGHVNVGTPEVVAPVKPTGK